MSPVADLPVFLESNEFWAELRTRNGASNLSVSMMNYNYTAELSTVMKQALHHFFALHQFAHPHPKLEGVDGKLKYVAGEWKFAMPNSRFNVCYILCML